MYKFCAVASGLIIISAVLDFVEWSTVGWVILGLFILNGISAWVNAKAKMADEANRRG